MTTTLALPTESQLPMAQSIFQEWKQEGEALIHQLRAGKAKLEMNQWDIGDWIVRGIENEQFNKKEAYNEAKRITGFDREYWRTVVWVVNRLRGCSLRIDTALKWSHVKELAYIRDTKLRETVLDYFNDGFDHPVRDIREHVQEELAKHEGQIADKHKGQTVDKKAKKWVFMQVSLTEEIRRDIKTLARLDHKDPDKFLREIVIEYLKRKDTAAKLTKAQKKSKR